MDLSTVKFEMFGRGARFFSKFSLSKRWSSCDWFQVHEDERKAVQQALRSLGEQLATANLSREQEVRIHSFAFCAWYQVEGGY